MRRLLLFLSILMLPVQAFADEPSQAKDIEPKTVQELLNKAGFDLSKAELSLPKSGIYPEYKDKLCPKLKNEITTHDIPLKEPLVASDDYEDIKPVIGGCPLSMFERHSVTVIQPSTYPKSDYRVYKLPKTKDLLIYVGDYKYSEDDDVSGVPLGRMYFSINNKCQIISGGQVVFEGEVGFFELDNEINIVNANPRIAQLIEVTSGRSNLCSFMQKSNFK